jgi:hypothetical protein
MRHHDLHRGGWKAIGPGLKPNNPESSKQEQIMPKVIATHTVENVTKWKSFDDERKTNLGAFGRDIESYVDPDGGNGVAVSMTVTDPEGLKAFLQSETCDAIMRKHGVIKPVSMLVDGA